MRAALCVVLGLALCLVSFTQAADKEEKEVKLKGTITCAKCDLKKEKKCMVVVVVKEDDKDVIYYFDPKGHEANHTKGANVCQEAKKGTVTGTVAEKGGKKVITVKDVKLD
ncbi:hypothetical protein AYO40_05960 [Planctomycetaceae bacterium SCGC AG-212-D15]|nr:hypothetical protein AYO40_05960 [Planctomycetaceae bacterium SCGC AG-212-D15]